MRLLVGTIDDALVLFRTQRVDTIFVDGNHLQPYVMTDLMAAQILLRPGGLLFVHDYGRENQEQINEAVDSFCETEGWVIDGKVWTTVKLARKQNA